MDQFIEVNGINYAFVTDFKHDLSLRKSFNELTMKTFGFDFEQWYQEGYWREQYIPYSLVHGEKLIANVSVNLLDFYIQGEMKRYIQIGTVMTDNDYTGQGLSRILMEKVMGEWEEKCDLIYLFANDRVVNFYPKFGFVPGNEYQYSQEVSKKNHKNHVRKIDVDNQEDKKFLFSIVSHTLPYSKFAMRNNPSLVMFYCTSFMKNNIYYLSDYDVIVVAEMHHETLHLQDVFSTQKTSMDVIIDELITTDIKRIVLGFVPEETESYEVNLLKEDDSTLFVKAIKDTLPEGMMFPILSHA